MSIVADVIGAALAGVAHSENTGYRVVGIQLGLECYSILLEAAAPGQADPPKLISLAGLPLTLDPDPSHRLVVRLVVEDRVVRRPA